MLDIISLLLVFIGSTTAVIYLLNGFYKTKNGESFRFKNQSIENISSFFEISKIISLYFSPLVIFLTFST